MSWIEKLYQTYENNTCAIGSRSDAVPLLPICHTTQNAHVTIAIDGNGNFLRASVVPKTEARTIIPATEDSAGRTSGTTPHPLCDKLQYVAADYAQFGGEKDVDPDFSASEFGKKYPLKKLIQSLEGIIGDDNSKDKLKDKNINALNSILLLKTLHEAIERKHVGQIRPVRLADFMESYEKSHAQIDLKRLNRTVLELYYQDLCPSKKTCHEQYMELLKEWRSTDESNKKLKAIQEYVRKGCIISDLVTHKVLHVEQGATTLLNQWPGKEKMPEIFKLLPGGSNNKGENKPWQADAFVRWSVEIPGDPQPEAWLDNGLWESWVRYYSSVKTTKALCLVTGDNVSLADQHPAKIRNDGDKAKLISSNDLSGFTFRGRFTTPEEVCGIGSEVTQKAHSCLRWLIARQGSVEYVKDGKNVKPSLTIVAWAVSGAIIPDPFRDSLSLLLSIEDKESPKETGYTAQEVGTRLSKLIAGYSAKLRSTDDVVVMGLDSATPGRMAITFYRELTGSELLERVRTWHEGCAWLQRFGKDKVFVGAPSPRDIAEAAFGTWRDGKLQIDEKLRRATVERLLSCIVDGAQIPRDLVETCVRRASKRNGIERWEWEKALGIACALFRKLNEKEGYSMALDESRKTRDYLYGRLLALADSLEQWALRKAGEDRQTNAARLMQRFADYPYSTWRTIELSLAPYKARLGRQSEKRQALIDKVHSMFDPPEDYTSDKKLSGEFLLGYHCQRAELWKSKQDPNSAHFDIEGDEEEIS